MADRLPFDAPLRWLALLVGRPLGVVYLALWALRHGRRRRRALPDRAA